MTCPRRTVPSRAAAAQITAASNAKEGCPLMIHAERHGDERLLDAARTLDGIEVRYGQPADDDAEARRDKLLRDFAPPQPTTP